MKMSDVFDLPVNKPTVLESIGMSAKEVERMTYAAHAINCHDELVEALQELFNSVGGGDKSCGHEFSCICATEKTRNALKKARGEK